MFECREAHCAPRHFFFLIATSAAAIIVSNAAQLLNGGAARRGNRLARLLTRAKIGARHRIRFRIRCGSLGQRA
jgi:hypothetical protein